MQKTKLNYLLSCLFLFAHFFLLTATSNPPATPVVDGTVVARVWDDQDGNGRQNENINLEGVKVNLLTSSNAIVASATTNSSGLASFANVTPGSYKLEFVRPTDHRFTVQNAANTPEQNDSDAALNNGRTATFSLAAGEVFSDFDAGLWTPGRVEARVWDDRDGNGRQNEGSGANLDGVVVNLLNASNNPVLYPNGHINGGNPVTGVTSGGIALLDYVPADEPFKLEFELPEDHKFTSQNEPGTPESNDSDAALNNGRTGTFSADRGNQLFTQIDAGLWAPGTVIARVWDDRDGNGRQNENSSSNLEGVLVRLLNASNQPIIGPNGPVENETGTDGLATLDYVPADAPFKLEFVLPDDHKFTSQNEPGTPENNDSDAALNNGRTGTFSADRGSQEFTQIDAGLWAPGSVVARVWDDQDGNGRQNEGSGSNLEGVLVRLLNASNQQIVGPNGPVEGETGADGLATLGYVPADAPFKLEFVLPDDHKFTQQNRPGTPEANDSDAALNNGRTAVFSADRGSQAFTQIDAGLWTPGQVVAKVFEDLDGNGRQNEDAGVYGVRVNLLEANNQPVLRPNGSEVFAFTDCGTFEAVLDYVPADRPVKLEFVPASGAVFTQQNRPGTPESNDSDAALNNGRTSVFSADRGNQTLRDVDAGLTDRGDWDDASVATFVWNDVDNIGTQSGFERNNTGIAGVKVTLADRDGNSCICESTDASGIANLPAIAGRQYRLIYELPQDHRFTNKSGPLTSGNNSDADRNSGRTAVFNIGQGENITYIDAGLWAPGSVTTLVWNDIDNLGTQSGFEINNEGIGDVMVHLLESNGAAVINPNTNSAVTAMTDVDGVAVLDYVPADRNLRVSYDLPNADYKFTNKSGPITQGNNSDADRNSGRTGTFSLSKGSESINFVDAGMWAPGTVETLVWNDIDNIGTQSGFEVNNEGISGVTVRLLEANGDPVIDPNDGMPVVATTMANGVATLDYVPASRNLRLLYELPNDDYRFTTKSGSITQGNNSDADRNSGRTGTFSADRGSDKNTFIDAGMWAPGTVETLVWNDIDNIGTQSGFEVNNEGISGVTVRLLEANGDPVIDPNDGMPVTATTMANGVATLDYVPASRNLRLLYELPNDDYRFTTKSGSITQGNNSDADRNSGRTGTFSADRGSDRNTFIDAGMWAPGTVETLVWNDIDNIGTQSGFERNNTGIAGVVVELLEADGDPVIIPGTTTAVSATTNAAGEATLTYVPASRNLRLKYNLPNSDYRFTTKSGPITQGNNSDADRNSGRTGTFSADRGSDKNTFIDAGMWAPGEAIAYVWEDANTNGRQDNSETGIYGLRVNLLEANGSPVLRPNGTEVFAFTECGSFEATLDYVPASRPLRLEFVPFDGGTFTSANATSDSRDSDANVNSGRTATFQASKGSQTFTDIDAGFTDRGSWDDAAVQAFVWDDRDGDGIQDSGERNSAGLGGVKVRLTDTDGNTCICEETTNNGQVTLPAIGGENYRIVFDLPEDHKFTGRFQGNDGTRDSDANTSSNNRGWSQVFSLAAGQTKTDIDAGLWAPGTITAFVWDDRDGDGIQDSGERNSAGLDGISVSLTEENGTTILETKTTGPNGQVVFEDVPADRPLRLRFEEPTDHKFTLRDAVSDESKDSDPNTSSGSSRGLSETFAADRGSDDHQNIDAGLWAPGTVTAFVWDDRDGDGNQDSGERNSAGLDGISVSLTEENGTTILETKTTGPNGQVVFEDVPADRPLRLRFEEPTDHKFTLRDAVSDESKDSDPNTSSGSSRGLSETFVADRGSDEHQNIDAGLWAPGTVTAFVWDDRDGDGIQDSGERNGAGLSGITVSLTEENGTVLISNSTGANGQVTFSNVPADRPLRLRFEEPMNYKLTIRDVGNDESKDSDPNTSSGSSRGLSETFVADRGSDEHLNIDAGLWAPGTVTAFVWDDRDGDGIQDSGERNGAGLSGVNVELTEEDGTTILASATTEADGRVSFNNVPADRPLRLRFTELAFHKFTIRDVGNDESKDSDPNTSSGSSRGLSETFAADRGSDDHQNIDAGLWAPGTVIAFVWEDLDGDGIQDSGERSSAGIDGVIVELLETNDQVFDEVVTTNNGQAIFEDVPADRELRLRFTEPSGYTFTTRFAGSDGSRDSDANTSGGSSLGKSQTFAADRGSDEITHIDAGLVSNGGSILVGSRENVTSTVSPFANDEIEAISEGQLTTGLDFRPGLTPAEVQINSIEELTLFPVPANDRLNVMFTLAKQQEAVYSILDQSGRVLRTERRDLASGINRIDLDVFQLPAGSYYFQLRTADQVLNKSFLIVR